MLKRTEIVSPSGKSAVVNHLHKILVIAGIAGIAPENIQLRHSAHIDIVKHVAPGSGSINRIVIELRHRQRCITGPGCQTAVVNALPIQALICGDP